MQQIFLSSLEYNGYISVIKLLIFLILFFLWLPILNWVYKDAIEVGTKEHFWSLVVFSSGAVGALIWLLIPIFIVGLLFFIVSTVVASLAYVSHRNALVLDFERVLTVEHFKKLVTRQDIAIEEAQGFKFITSNRNKVPMPEPRTPDFYGYRTAYEIFTDAIWRRVKDIIFLPTSQGYNVKYSIDGASVKRPDIEKDKMNYFIHFIKNLGNLELDEKRKPQKGTFTIVKDKEEIKLEVQTAGSTAGEQVRIKRIGRDEVSKLSEIGLTSHQYEQLSKIRDMSKGLFIVSGPKKSGLTTTLYAFIRNHDPFLNNVNTLEKKPSAKLENITQNIYSPSESGTMNYAQKLQEVVRMGADVVGVADCSEPQTAKVACEAAKSGKIVYVALKAKSVKEAFSKWLTLVDDKKLAVNSFLGISNQRLIRKLCEECKQGYQPNKELLRKFNLPADKAKVLYRPGKVQYNKRGKPTTCEACQGTGFVGRTGVFETLIIDNDKIKQELAGLKSISDIDSILRRAKVRSLQEQMLKMSIEGITAINEMVRILSNSGKNKSKSKKQ